MQCEGDESVLAVKIGVDVPVTAVAPWQRLTFCVRSDGPLQLLTLDTLTVGTCKHPTIQVRFLSFVQKRLSRLEY
eukprot:130812-Rhodomonas_salina.1